MIEILDGTHETIKFNNALGVRLFHNVDYEDYPEHWHTAIEIIFPLHSTYDVIVGDKNYHLETEDIIIINSGVLHALKAPPQGERVILQFSDYLLYSIREMETLLAMLPPVLHLSEKNDPQRLYGFIKKQLEGIVVEYGQERTFFGAAIYARLIEIFVHIGRSTIWGRKCSGYTAGDNNPHKKKEYMETIMHTCNYINQNFMNQITLEEAAEVSGFSKFHFTRIFKQCMNLTFHEYVNNKRVIKAEELLSSSTQSITQVAMNSGFSSISAFNRTFKTLKGCSPSDYRNMKDRV